MTAAVRPNTIRPLVRLPPTRPKTRLEAVLGGYPLSVDLLVTLTTWLWGLGLLCSHLSMRPSTNRRHPFENNTSDNISAPFSSAWPRLLVCKRPDRLVTPWVHQKLVLVTVILTCVYMTHTRASGQTKCDYSTLCVDTPRAVQVIAVLNLPSITPLFTLEYDHSLWVKRSLRPESYPLHCTPLVHWPLAPFHPNVQLSLPVSSSRP